MLSLATDSSNQVVLAFGGARLLAELFVWLGLEVFEVLFFRRCPWLAHLSRDAQSLMVSASEGGLIGLSLIPPLLSRS